MPVPVPVPVPVSLLSGASVVACLDKTEVAASVYRLVLADLSLADIFGQVDLSWLPVIKSAPTVVRAICHERDLQCVQGPEYTSKCCINSYLYLPHLSPCEAQYHCTTFKIRTSQDECDLSAMGWQCVSEDRLT